MSRFLKSCHRSLAITQAVWLKIVVLGLLSLSACAQQMVPGAGSIPALVPMPQDVRGGEGRLALTKQSRILYMERGTAAGLEGSLKPLADVLAGEIELLTGLRLEVAAIEGAGPARGGDIALSFTAGAKIVADEVLQDQSYELVIDRSRIVIHSASFKGVAFGTSTLLQCLSIEGDHFSFPAIVVRDAPHAAYRGLMIDVARQPHSIETLREAIRMARLYKIRYLHLHLTDDQHFTFPFEPVTSKLENNFSYSRQELEDLVAYADARGVTIIPEMDLPGHSSRLMQSGYLDPGKSHYDVADPANYERIGKIIDAILDVFHTSPYFHIGGDESGAGDRLVPFLAAVNKRIRGYPEVKKRRLMVWEGFHGAPTDQLPATGPDRIIVHSWESSYNAPWDLLNAGYTLINSSWKPLYVVGNGGTWHPGRPIKQWTPEVLYGWNKDLFMHWQPGRAVFEDAHPDPDGDDDRTDHQWDAERVGKAGQILGGQLIFWEQSQETVVPDLRHKLPAVAERLWNPEAGSTFQAFTSRAKEVDTSLFKLVQPVAILPEPAYPGSPKSLVFQTYRGEEVEVELHNLTRIPGTIRYAISDFYGDFGYYGYRDVDAVTPDATRYDGPFVKPGSFAIRAQLFRDDGTPVPGSTVTKFNNWPMRVRVTEYDIDGRSLGKVPDLSKVDDALRKGSYALPMIRGDVVHVDFLAHRFDATLLAPGDGEYTITLDTYDGRANQFFDINRDGKWQAEEKFIATTKGEGKTGSFKATLTKGVAYGLRIDHLNDMAGVVVIGSIEGPEISGRRDISFYLEPLKPAKKN